VTRHHGRIVLVELDADRTQHTDAAKALHSLLGRWRWT
jgi:hypothetical protein